MSDSTARRAAAEAVARRLKQRDEVQGVWLFGSVQRAREWAESDVDLLVLLAAPPPLETVGAEHDGVSLHLHFTGPAQWERLAHPDGEPFLRAMVGGGEPLFLRTDALAEQGEALRAFPNALRLYHLAPHLEALLRWARDLRQRMALGDERPRRAAARQWQVDQHSAAVLLIEKGHYPHKEPTTQALNARLFVPNMTTPEEIEEFVRGRVEEWLLPPLRQWARETDALDEALLQKKGLPPLPRLLAFAARAGWLEAGVGSQDGLPYPHRIYRLPRSASNQ